MARWHCRSLAQRNSAHPAPTTTSRTTTRSSAALRVVPRSSSRLARLRPRTGKSFSASMSRSVRRINSITSPSPNSAARTPSPSNGRTPVAARRLVQRPTKRLLRATSWPFAKSARPSQLHIGTARRGQCSLRAQTALGAARYMARFTSLTRPSGSTIFASAAFQPCPRHRQRHQVTSWLPSHGLRSAALLDIASFTARLPATTQSRSMRATSSLTMLRA